ncbi:MAG: ABC transporter permease, partial [Terriglobales bacterium]
AEVALALMLAAGAGLMLKSFARLMAVNPGFQPQQVLTLGTSLAGPRYAKDAAIASFEREAVARLAALPGVEAAGLGTNLPLSGSHSREGVTIVGQPAPARGHFPHPDVHRISSGYLAAMGLPLLRGRNFGAADAATAPDVVLVNQQFARQYWPGQDAIGKQILLGRPGPKTPAATVVGVVGNTRQYGLDAAIRLEIYFPFQQDPPDTPQFVLRTRLPPLGILGIGPAATAVLHQLDPEAPVVGMQTMNQVVAASVANPRATLWLLGLFGGLALTLAAIGTYGVVSYATLQRTNEIGIRMALGADGGAIARLVGGASLRLLAAGSGVGLIGALAAGRLMASQLFGVSAADLEVLAGATSVLFAVGVLACAVPIHRASRLAPWLALRRD